LWHAAAPLTARGELQLPSAAPSPGRHALTAALALTRRARGPQAFVCFENPEEARRACQKDRETFSEKWGDRYVRVYPTLESDVADMQQALQQQNMSGPTVRATPACMPGPACPVCAVVLAPPQRWTVCCVGWTASGRPAARGLRPPQRPPAAA
jgi:hypothetical protein